MTTDLDDAATRAAIDQYATAIDRLRLLELEYLKADGFFSRALAEDARWYRLMLEGQGSYQRGRAAEEVTT